MYPVKRRKKIIETADEKIRGPSKATAGAPPAGLLPLILMEIVAYKKSAASTVHAFESGSTGSAPADSANTSGSSAAAAATSAKKPKKRSKDKEKEKEKDKDASESASAAQLAEPEVPLTPSVRSAPNNVRTFVATSHIFSKKKFLDALSIHWF